MLTGTAFVLPKPDGPVELPDEPVWAILLLVVASAVGLASGVAAVLILRGEVAGGLRVGIGATLVNLVAGGLLTFYVAQFEAMGSAIGHLVLLALLLDHAHRVGRIPHPAVTPGRPPLG